MRASSATRLLLTAVTLAVCLLTAGPAPARRHDPEKLPVTRIRDLHYGDVLFYYYQGEDFESITRLLAYQHWDLVQHHREESELLLGGLYLQLGMHNEAGERFQALLNEDVPIGVRDKAWFYLARVWYTRSYFDKAEQALLRIQGRLSPELEAQKEHLLANVFMHEGKFAEAERVLLAARGSPAWLAYARFNLGVALVRQQKLADADPFLTAVGTMYAQSSELLALKDRANLALGFAYLQANEPERARTALERVRLSGPYSNKALLGTGWADAALGNYQRALTPWLELRNRNMLDAAVQESYLAVPYAFSKLGAPSQSAEYYESAVQSYDAENARLDEAIGRVRDGKLLEQVAYSERESAYGWFWQLQRVPDAPESRYLYSVLAGHDFQEGLKNYRHMVFMGHTLERWDESMDAFGDMIDTREHAYAERLPKTDALLASGVVNRLEQRRNDLDGQISAIEGNQDVAALGSAEERDQWARIQRIEAALSAAPVTPENAEVRDRLRLVKGVLYFRLNESFKARLWQQHRAMRDVDLALHEAQSRWIRVERARQSVPTNTGEFAARVAALKARIDALQGRLAATEQKQSAYLSQVAVAQLQQQKDRLDTYQVQARFALAEMYDRAANQESAPAARPPATPGSVPPGAQPAPLIQEIPQPESQREATPPPGPPEPVPAEPQSESPSPSPSSPPQPQPQPQPQSQPQGQPPESSSR